MPRKKSDALFHTEKIHVRIVTWIYVLLFSFYLAEQIFIIFSEKSIWTYIIPLLFCLIFLLLFLFILNEAQGKIEFTKDGVRYQTWLRTKFFPWDSICKITKTEIPNKSLFYPYLIICTAPVLPKGWLIWGNAFRKNPIMCLFWRSEILTVLQQFAPNRLLPVVEENLP